MLGGRLVCRSRTGVRARLLEQTQNILRGRVGGRQHRSARLLQDLRPGHRRGFSGKVGVADLRFTRGDVLESNLQTARVGLEGVALERAKPPAKNRNFSDCGAEHIAGFGGSAEGQRVGLAALQTIEEEPATVDGGATDAAGRHRFDADAHLLRGCDRRSKLESRATASDVEVRRRA